MRHNRTIGMFIVEERMRKAKLYRAGLSPYVLHMKKCARWCAFALKMYYNDRVTDGVRSMEEARYHQSVALEEK